MSFTKVIRMQRLKPNAAVPEKSSEWSDIKQMYMDAGKLISWTASDWNDSDISTVKITTDTKATWIELKNKSKELGDWHTDYRMIMDSAE